MPGQAALGRFHSLIAIAKEKEKKLLLLTGWICDMFRLCFKKHSLIMPMA